MCQWEEVSSKWLVASSLDLLKGFWIGFDSCAKCANMAQHCWRWHSWGGTVGGFYTAWEVPTPFPPHPVLRPERCGGESGPLNPVKGEREVAPGAIGISRLQHLNSVLASDGADDQKLQWRD